MTSDFALLQKIYDDEETYKIIYSIREELMDMVMYECYRIYIKRQTIAFIVQCAYDAMIKFLGINFYYHEESPNTKDLLWMPDKPIEPSPKDTWAHSAVPIRSGSVNMKGDDIYNERDTTKECHCCHPCDCLLEQQGVFRHLSTSSKRYPSRVKFSPKTSKITLKMRESKATMISSSTDKSTSFYESEATVGTASTAGNSHLTKRTIDSREVTPKIPDAIRRGSQASIVRLPPIRVNTKLTSKAEDKTQKKKSKQF